MNEEKLEDRLDQSYIEGSRRAWLSMLRQCLWELGVDDPEAGKIRWVIERQETVAMLRRCCENSGDNDWPDDLHLADVIDKHINWPNR